MAIMGPKSTFRRNSGYKDRPWIPRFWHGMSLAGWTRLLVRNRFAIGLPRLAMCLAVTGFAVLNEMTRWIYHLLLGWKITRTEVKHPPIFIVGHWRSGTTLMHELLILDKRFSFPATYACFLPNHFLLTSWLFRPLLGWILPSRRPMDNMDSGADRPQEDEFALCNLGVPSPYLTIAFPNHPPQYQEYLDMQGVSARDRRRWQRALLWFVKCLTLRDPRRLVLKSPPHTARIKTLLEIFPDAKFVHIVRDPCSVFPSTINLWTRLYRDQGLQVPRYEGLEEHVFETFNRMYAAFERDKDLLEQSQFCELRYEDLVHDPVGQIEQVYENLGLDEFEAVRPALEDYARQHANYRTNRYELSDETRAEIHRRWAEFIERYGYADEPVTLRFEQFQQARQRSA